MTADSRPSDASPLPTRLLGPVLAWLLLAATATASAQEVVPYASGGVGLNSQEELIARQGEFSLKLVFAEKWTGS